jgi:heme/copper-type cytochrome/quinol oxidase subunit 2
MKKKLIVSEILFIGLLITAIVGLPAAIFGYQQWLMSHRGIGKTVSIVGRNDKIPGKHGAWIVQRNAMWSYNDSASDHVIEVRQNEVVTLMLTTIDTTHEFSLDGYDLEKKVYPGQVTEINFTANLAGEFAFQCTNYCGTGHDEMVGKLVVVPERQLAAVQQ